MTDLPIKTYSVTVDGFPPVLFSGRTPAKARVASWRSYQNYDDRCDFKQFLRISRIVRADDPPGIGKRVMVAGKPATTVISNNGSSRPAFVRDGSNAFFTAHPSEVEEIAPDTANVMAKDNTGD